MAEFIPFTQTEPTPTDAAVRFELHQGDALVSTFVLDGDNILVGTVPGCDVRLNQGDLPPLLCLLTQEAGGLRLRQLALALTLSVNGEAGGDRLVSPGDRLSFGAFSAHLHFTPRQVGPAREGNDVRQQILEEGLRRLAASQKQLEDDRRDWEQDAERQAEELAAKTRKAIEDANALAHERAAFEAEGATRAQATSEESVVSVAPALVAGPAPNGGLASIAPGSPLYDLKLQLAAYRDELYDRYQKRRDHLLALQESVNRAARKVQEEKHELNARAERAHTAANDTSERERTLTARAEELEQARTALVDQHRLVEDWQKEVEREYAARSADVSAAEKRQARERERLAGFHAQYQNDLARLDRLQVELEERDRLCDDRAKQLDEQAVKLKEFAAHLQGQATELEDLDGRQASLASTLAEREAEVTSRAQMQIERAAMLDAHQAALAALRSRAERLQADLVQRESQLTEQRLRQERLEGMLQEFQRRLTEQTANLHRQQETWHSERRQIEERCTAMEARDVNVRVQEQQLEELRQRLDARRVVAEDAQRQLAQNALVLRMRARRLQKVRTQLHEQRDVLRARERQIVEQDHARAALQEQLHKRAESLGERERQLGEQQQQLDQAIQDSEARRLQLNALVTTSEQDIARRLGELARGETDLAERGRVLDKQQRQLQHDLAALETERTAALRQRQEADAAGRQAVDQRERLQLEVALWKQRLPEMVQQAQGSLDRLGKAREQLRDHLREVHTYVQQCQGEHQTTQRDLLQHAEQLRQQQSAQLRLQDEHRLAVSVFRQELSEWQGEIAELKRSRQVTEERAEPLQVLDRLRQTAIESIYRVVDSRRGEAILRQLAATQPEERKVEFRERFTQAASVRHVNLAATLEVLERDGCPAALQEAIDGVPSGAWHTAAASAPVWLRLLRQAAAGLQAAHEAGMTHGHLHAGRLLLTETGALKICGLGEPDWLVLEKSNDAGRDVDGVLRDLQALGRIANGWLIDVEPQAALHVILDRLLSDDPAKRFSSARALGEHLDRVQAGDDAAAWEQFMNGIGKQLDETDASGQRLAA